MHGPAANHSAPIKLVASAVADITSYIYIYLDKSSVVWATNKSSEGGEEEEEEEGITVPIHRILKQALQPWTSGVPCTRQHGGRRVSISGPHSESVHQCK